MIKVSVIVPIYNIEEDLLKREFTINAVAYNLETDEIVDVTGGTEDIKNGILRAVSEENFKDEPLRSFRAYRFQAIYGFEISTKTLDAIKKYSDFTLINDIDQYLLY